LQTRIQESIKAAIDTLQQEVRSIHLEIRPQFLVPDTNCFIDYLHGIASLLAVKKFTIIVPLVGMFTAMSCFVSLVVFIVDIHCGCVTLCCWKHKKELVALH